MCWEMDYLFFAEQEKASKIEKAQEKRAGVIRDLLAEAGKQAEKSDAETTPVPEVTAAK